jgi:hypothetical protein
MILEIEIVSGFFSFISFFLFIYKTTKNKIKTMAKKSTTTTTNFLKKSRKTRPGVHSKKKTSVSKNSKHYKKAYKGQGR